MLEPSGPTKRHVYLVSGVSKSKLVSPDSSITAPTLPSNTPVILATGNVFNGLTVILTRTSALTSTESETVNAKIYVPSSVGVKTGRTAVTSLNSTAAPTGCSSTDQANVNASPSGSKLAEPSNINSEFCKPS